MEHRHTARKGAEKRTAVRFRAGVSAEHEGGLKSPLDFLLGILLDSTLAFFECRCCLNMWVCTEADAQDEGSEADAEDAARLDEETQGTLVWRLEGGIPNQWDFDLCGFMQPTTLDLFSERGCAFEKGDTL